MVSNSKTGLIFNIQKFSVHDGPGIRDVVFMKGCPLRCRWCSNPESQNVFAEIGYNQNKCIGIMECGLCLEACPINVIKTAADKKIQIDREGCTDCGKCVEVCPAQAITLFGEIKSIEEILKVLQEENVSWRANGGITVSGGELLLQAEFVCTLLEECKKLGIDTAIETSGHGSWNELEKVCRHSNLIFYDLKCMEPAKHKTYTGLGNELILDNLLKIAVNFPTTPVIVRTPVIPGFNDSLQDIQAIVKFLTQIQNLKDYELLGYHAFGEPKYGQLGRKYQLDHLPVPQKEFIADLNQKARALLKEQGILPG